MHLVAATDRHTRSRLCPADVCIVRARVNALGKRNPRLVEEGRGGDGARARGWLKRGGGPEERARAHVHNLLLISPRVCVWVCAHPQEPEGAADVAPRLGPIVRVRARRYFAWSTNQTALCTRVSLSLSPSLAYSHFRRSGTYAQALAPEKLRSRSNGSACVCVSVSICRSLSRYYYFYRYYGRRVLCFIDGMLYAYCATGSLLLLDSGARAKRLPGWRWETWRQSPDRERWWR